MEGKVSIIIPIYNSEKFIEKCLASVINQTYKNIEIILINDGSTDKSLNLIEKYKDDRIIIINQENKGVSEARNNGIKKSSGKYLMFLDSDDWLETNMIEKMIKKIKEEKVDVVRCNYFRDYEDGTQKKGSLYSKDIANKKINKEEIRNKILLQIINGKMPGYLCLLIIKKEIIKKLKPLNVNLSIMEDTIFYIDLLLNIHTLYIYDEYLYHYYCNFDSASKSEKNYLKKYENILLVNEIEENALKQINYNENGYIELNTTHAKMIENVCYCLFKSCRKNDTLKYFENIINNHKVKLIVNKADLKKIKLNKRISTKYIKEGKINTLYKYYIIMNILSKIKTLITRRKE